MAPAAVRVNAVCPGAVRTPILAHLEEAGVDESALAAMAPMARIGAPDEVAKAVAWLLLGQRELRHWHCEVRRWRMVRAIEPSERNIMQSLEPDWAGADPFEPSFRDDPYPALNQLREAHAVNLTPVGTYRITRFEDVKNVFKDADTSMTLANGESPNFHPADERGSFREFVLNLDDEKHLRLRKLLYKSFNNRVVRRFEVEAHDIVDKTITQALADGGMDVIENLAHRVPSQNCLPHHGRTG